ncbi:MAG: aminopeptidase [Treponema sp.]|nr:aminopeptidase [Treponema sp.]
MKHVFTFIHSNLPIVLSAFVLVSALVACSGCYSMKQGTAYLGYLNRAVPLEKLAAREDTPEEERIFVERVDTIRSFATGHLGLKGSKNYTKYVALDRDFLAAVVSASAPDSFTRHYWWFPVVGRMPYKGFFNVPDARREREKLEAKELDVWIRGVGAFSTLGWFKDPLFSFMREYSDKELADLIIHELVHSTVWLKHHTQFNEQLAAFIGTEGARLFMETTGDAGNDSGNADDLVAADRAAYYAFIQSLIAELEVMFAATDSREERLARKAEIIAAAKTRFEAEYDSLFHTDTYRFFIELPVNNAYLDLFRLYHEEDRYFADLFERSGSDLPAFIAAARTLNPRQRRNADPRAAFETALGLR